MSRRGAIAWWHSGAPLMALLAGAPLLAAPPAVAVPFANWDAAFGVSHAPQAVHFKAQYRDQGGALHVIEAWRDGTRFLHRNTDARMDLYLIARPAVPGDYSYRLVDRSRRRVIDVERGNLYRIGVFADWYGLAHVLDRVHGADRLTDATVPVGAAPAKPCAWRGIERRDDDGGRHRTRVCWSARWGVPMEIWNGESMQAEPDFKMLEIEALPRAQAEALQFEPPAGFQYIDANRDIDPNSD